MWMNTSGNVYFFPKEFICFNFSSKRTFRVPAYRKEEWATNGKSKLLGPEILGRWS